MLADHMIENTTFPGCESDVEYVVFKCRPLPPKIYLDQDEDTVGEELPSLQGMTFEDYGKGYILRAPSDSPYLVISIS